MHSPIGVFDSGYGGLTVMKELVRQLPRYDYLYLGDNARAPYGNRSFDTVYRYTLQCVKWFFQQGCPLVILACNTASAKALRTIQQKDLPGIDPTRRVLGVIRPTTEMIGRETQSGSVGILATTGTVSSGSYVIEAGKFFPGIKVHQQACPVWVPLIENNEHKSPGAEYFIRKYTTELMNQSADIDTVLLACTHYPLIEEEIRQTLPSGVKVISQGQVVSDSLADYLRRHPDMETRLSQGGSRVFYTTDSTTDFDRHAALFYGAETTAKHVDLPS